MREQRRNLLYFRPPLINKWGVSDGIDLSNVEKELKSILHEVAERSGVELNAIEEQKHV